MVQWQLCLACVNLVLLEHNLDSLRDGVAFACNATKLLLCLRVAVELDFCLYCSVLSTVFIIILRENHISGWYIFHAACVCLWSAHLWCMSPFNNVLHFLKVIYLFLIPVKVYLFPQTHHTHHCILCTVHCYFACGVPPLVFLLFPAALEVFFFCFNKHF